MPLTIGALVHRGKLVLLVALTFTFVSCIPPAHEPQNIIKELFDQIEPPAGANLLYSKESEVKEYDPRHVIWGLYGGNIEEFYLQQHYEDTLTGQGWKIVGHMETGFPIYCSSDYPHITVTMVDRAAYLYDPPVPSDILTKAKADYRVLFSVDVIYWDNRYAECEQIGSVE